MNKITRHILLVSSIIFCELAFGQDLDGDLVPDASDDDIDNDGILNSDEGTGSAIFVTSPEAFWSFENTTNDVSGNGYNAGTGTNAPASYSTDAVQGDFSAEFNGIDHEIRYSVDNNFMEQTYTNISFSAWIKVSDLFGPRVIYEEGGGTHGSCLWIDNGTLTYSVRNSSSQQNITHPTTLTIDNQWHHVAATFDSNGDISVYLDGVGNTGNAGYTVIPAHSGDGYVGGTDTNSAGVVGNFAGLMDAVRYESGTTWSAAEILTESMLDAPDTDNDGISNDYDLDSDNDGIADIIEAGGVDVNNDGMVDDPTDSNGNGFADTFDAADGGSPLPQEDADGDGYFNFEDIDADGDGIIDNIEAQVSSGSPVQPSGVDSDGDGIDNSFDTDSGNDFLIPINTDEVGDPDYLDTDADEDGYSDLDEAYDTDNNGTTNTEPSGSDTDQDGLDDQFDLIVGPNSSTNPSNNGQTSDDFTNLDQTGTAERDWREKRDLDGDNVGDGLDEDTDNDGIPNKDENSGEAIFVTTPVAFWGFDNNTNDLSGNGNDENTGTVSPGYSQDKVQGSASASFNGSTQLVRYSQDGGFMESQLSVASYSAWIKPSSVSGSIIIIDEGGSSNGLTLWLNNGVPTFSVRSGGAQVDVASSGTIAVDNEWRHIAATFDNGLISVYLDGIQTGPTWAGYSTIPNHGSDGYVGGGNDNAAGISAFFEGLIDAVRYSDTEAWSPEDIAAENNFESSDADNDGLTNDIDLDSDNDGIPDLVEAGGTDSDENGTVDVLTDTDGDGWVDSYDPDNGGTALDDNDIDIDGFPNRIDIDADGDGIIDLIEGQLSTGSPVVPSGSDADQDGIDDNFDPNLANSLIIPVNTDGTDEPDYLDLDSDNDGINDQIEGYDTDGDGTANITPAEVDTDEDGLDDNFDQIVGPNPSSNISNNGQTSDNFPNLSNPGTSERDWRELDDMDGDLIGDGVDADRDNDGIPNLLEYEASFVTSPIAFWTFDGNTDDQSGNGYNENTGTVAPTYSSDARQGTHSASFNGIDQLVRYSQDDDFMETALSAASYSAWIKPSSVSGTMPIIDEGGGTNGLTLWLDNGLVTFSTRDNNSQVNVTVGDPLTIDNEWHHVAATFDNGNITVYLDGVASSSVATGYAVVSDHGSNGFVAGTDGNSAGINGYYAGLIDAVRYDNTDAWSAAEILTEATINTDQDNDGIDNDSDLDSDGDGITDIIEAGGVDTDNNGRADDATDTDLDGYADLFDSDDGGTALAIPNSDANPVRDFLDIDSDNDGITDNFEGQEQGTYTAPSGMDTDGDGWDDSYDPDNGGSFLLSNVDMDSEPDYRDRDSDGDGNLDFIEGFDDDGDGDALDDLELRASTFESNAGNPGFYTNVDGNTDGKPDWTQDLDLNGIADFLQFGNTYFKDTDGDGLVDLFDTNTFGASFVGSDLDSDGIPDFRDADNSITLPVELLYFTAKLMNNSVSLKWATVSELNNELFIVQRSQDLIEWKEIAMVGGAGSTTILQEYNHTDHRPLEGISYYRILQRDFDGTESLSPIQSISHTFSGLGNTISIYPNPVLDNKLVVSFSNPISSESQVYLVSINGKTISLGLFYKGETLKTFIIDEKNPSGVYFIKVVNQSEEFIEQLLFGNQ